MVSQGIPENKEVFQWVEDLKQGFSQPEPENFELGKEKIESIKTAIEDINSMIKNREALSKEIFREGERIKTEINNMLMEKRAYDDPNEIMDPKERTELKKKKIEISELQLNEKISCWKDIALLKKELRDYERELSERESRGKMLDKILE